MDHISKNTPKLFLISCFLIFLSSSSFAQGPKPEQDCINAIPVCNSIYTFPTPYLGAGSLPNEISNSINCILSEESNSVWFKLSVLSSGKINFTISPNQVQDDYDWSLFNLSTASCTDIAKISSLNVSCNNSQMGLPPGTTGTSSSSNQNQGDQHQSPFNAPIPALAGQTFLLVVTSSQPTDGFQIDFTKSTASFGSLPFQFTATDVDCTTDSIHLTASKNIMCSSIAANGSDFLIVDAEGNYYPTVMSQGKSCSGGTTTKEVLIKFTGHAPKNTSFSIKAKNGTDGNTLQDECGAFIADGAMIASIKADKCVVVVKIFPNVMTPNNDGVNDTFRITGNDGTSSLKILNRWGETIYETKTYKNDWDGGNATAGVYYYIYESIGSKASTGTLTIIR